MAGGEESTDRGEGGPVSAKPGSQALHGNQDVTLRVLHRLHEWRVQTGWAGPDQYHPDRSLRHPMTVATFGRGYALLAALTGAEVYRASLKEACQLLRKDANLTGRFEHVCWGLPFGWHGNPDHFPYLITTAHAGLCLLAAHEATGDRRWLELAVDAGHWVCEEAGYDRLGPAGICFHYAPCEELRIRIHNVNAMAAGFLACLAQCCGNERFATMAEAAMRYTAGCMREEGSWPYIEPTGEAKPKGPESHTGYIIASMANFILARPDMADVLWPCLEHGLSFYCTHQYDGARALQVRDAVSSQEARLWAHGWGIAALSLAHRCTHDGRRLEQAAAAVQWSFEHLLKPSGAFRQFSYDNTSFLRQAGHMFYGLAYYLREIAPVN